MQIRAPLPEDSPAIIAIVRAHDVPLSWSWPAGKHGLVADDGAVRAFAILSQTPWGLVIDELWEEKSRAGVRALSLLSRHIEAVAANLAREGPLMCGGIVTLERAEHIKALKKRGYTVHAVILAKRFA